MKNLELNIELSTHIARFQDLDIEALSVYDSVYLGDPYCDLGIHNLLECKEDLLRAIGMLQDANKLVYLRTYVEPWSSKFDSIRKLIELSVSAGIDGVEVQDMGVLRVMKTDFHQTPVHIGSFIKVFNPQTLKVLATQNVTRLIPYPELSLAEIQELRSVSSVNIELQIHGKLPLGYTELCTLKPQKTKTKAACSEACYQKHFLHSNTQCMLAAGRVTFSHRDMCLINHMQSLIEDKHFNLFRVEGQYESNHYRKQVGQAYQDFFQNLDSKTNDKILADLNAHGLCNGFYFDKPGMDYV